MTFPALIKLQPKSCRSFSQWHKHIKPHLGAVTSLRILSQVQALSILSPYLQSTPQLKPAVAKRETEAPAKNLWSELHPAGTTDLLRSRFKVY